MKVSGVTILNDALRLRYPFRESLLSLLPLVDELVVNVGQGGDGTWEEVAALGDPRLRPFRSVWDLTPRGGATLSEQTNLALARCSGDWAIYLQADEVLHEGDRDVLRAALERHRRRDTEGLLFDYLHFFQRPDVVSDDWLSFYPRAVRVVKLGIGVESVGDAAGFARRRGRAVRGLIKAASGARIFHYGWCDEAGDRLARARALSSLCSEGIDLTQASLFPGDLSERADLRPYHGTHPGVMAGRLSQLAAPAMLRPSGTPPLVRAGLRVIGSPRLILGPGRPLVPTWLSNLRWRWIDRRMRA